VVKVHQDKAMQAAKVVQLVVLAVAVAQELLD
jgi:hypothetical protein